MTRSSNNITRSEKTRSLILSSAEKLFLDNGYHGTSMRQIAHNAQGLAVGGLYNHFESKEDIFCELVKDRTPWEKMLRIFETAEGLSGPVILEETFIALQKLLFEHRNFAALLILDMREMNGQTTRTMTEKIYPGIIDFIARVNEKGGLREDISILTVIRSFAGMLIGYMMTSILGSALIGSDLEYTLPNLQQTLYDSSDMIDAMFFGIIQPDLNK